MLSIINVGRPRAGKTTKAKEILNKVISNGRKSDIIIYDVNNEYSNYYDKPFLTFDEFSKSLKGVKNKIILIEESTIFFSTKSTDKIIQELLVRRRHENNTIILNFHSFASVPKYIFDLLNYVIVFKTNDTEETIKSKTNNPKLMSAFKEVRDNSNLHFNKTFNFYS